MTLWTHIVVGEDCDEAKEEERHGENKEESSARCEVKPRLNRKQGHAQGHTLHWMRENI